MSKKILVTGGNGFIGGYLVEYYTTRNFQVHSLDIHKESKYDVYNYYSTDITNIDNVLSIDNSFDIIFHCAGSASVLHSTENPIDDFIINVQGTLNMLEFVRKSGSHSFIFLSTVSVFDREGELPLTEISVKKATSPYGAGKMASESYCQAYYRTYGIDTRIAYPMVVYKQEMFAKSKYRYKFEECPVAESFTAKVINLPIFPDIKKEEIDYVAKSLIDILKSL